MSYSSEVLADSPALYLRLGEAAGTTGANSVLDASGNARHGTPNGTYTFGAAGPLAGDANTALSLAGVAGSYVGVTGINTLLGGATAATLEAWVYRSAAGKMVTLGCNGSTVDRVSLVWFTDGRLYFQLPLGFAPSVPLAGTGWHHVVGVFNGALALGSRATIYVDGVGATPSGGGSVPAAISSAAAIGAYEVGRDAANGRNTDGIIDEPAVYLSALSAARALSHYNAGRANGLLLARRRAAMGVR